MAKIGQYGNDNNITLNDKLLGTDADDNDKTKNFKISALVQFLISNGVGNAGPIGPIGPTGNPGTNGEDGQNGLSAYQIALQNGFVGTQTEWLVSLIGPPGESEENTLPYKELAYRLSQNGTSDPLVAKVFVDQLSSNGLSLADPLFFDPSFAYVGVGLYKLIITKHLNYPLMAYNCDLSFSDNKIKATGYSSGSNSYSSFTEFFFETRNSAGVLTDSLISFTNLYLKLWD